MEHMDIHSWSRPDLIRVRHLELDLDVRFDRRVLEGSVTLHVDRIAGSELVLDTRGLAIHSVENAAGYELGPADPILGAPLKIQMLPDTSWVRVYYSTSPQASGLQWLDPPQTAGKVHPFLYTQSQAIHARSWIPLQDTPAVRVTFEAEIRVPAGLRAVMGAAMSGSHFRMDQPVPSYLIALAAGDLEFRALGERSGVYAEPALIDAAAYEFADTEAMIGAVGRCTARTAGAATICWCCRPVSPSAAWRTPASPSPRPPFFRAIAAWCRWWRTNWRIPGRATW